MNSMYKGINETELEKIKKELSVRSLDVYNTLKQLNTVVDPFLKDLVDSIYISYRRRYETISSCYNTIYENLLSITEEITRLNYKYFAKDEEISNIINNNIN